MAAHYVGHSGRRVGTSIIMLLLPVTVLSVSQVGQNVKPSTA